MLQEAQTRLLSHDDSSLDGSGDPAANSQSGDGLSMDDTSWKHNPRYSDYEDDLLPALQGVHLTAPAGNPAAGNKLQVSQEGDVSTLLNRCVFYTSV